MLRLSLKIALNLNLVNQLQLKGNFGKKENTLPVMSFLICFLTLFVYSQGSHLHICLHVLSCVCFMSVEHNRSITCNSMA